MERTTLTELRQIGRHLDEDIYPCVANGGIILPNVSTVSSNLGKRNKHATQRSRRSEARPWEGTSRREGSSCQTAPFISTSLQNSYEDELDDIHRYYPGTKVWTQGDGMWLLTESALLPGLRRAAIFLTGICYTSMIVRGWGFWKHPFAGLSWIGPRHTNFPDGSICAFHPTDGTWKFGYPLVELLDLYTLWALRHLHLEVIGRWPGSQAVFHPYERLIELKNNEYCGCGRSNKRYGECCREEDIAKNRLAIAVNFNLFYAGGLRMPPNAIQRSALEQSEPPRLSDVFS